MSIDLVFCGRQAIDGDTAQVGPQVAEKLGIPQITYAESIIELKGMKSWCAGHLTWAPSWSDASCHAC